MISIKLSSLLKTTRKQNAEILKAIIIIYHFSYLTWLESKISYQI